MFEPLSRAPNAESNDDGDDERSYTVAMLWLRGCIYWLHHGVYVLSGAFIECDGQSASGFIWLFPRSLSLSLCYHHHHLADTKAIS